MVISIIVLVITKLVKITDTSLYVTWELSDRVLVILGDVLRLTMVNIYKTQMHVDKTRLLQAYSQANILETEDPNGTHIVFCIWTEENTAPTTGNVTAMATLVSNEKKICVGSRPLLSNGLQTRQTNLSRAMIRVDPLDADVDISIDAPIKRHRCCFFHTMDT